MSPADLVSYLLGWNELVLKWLDQDDQGAKIKLPDTGFIGNNSASGLGSSTETMSRLTIRSCSIA